MMQQIIILQQSITITQMLLNSCLKDKATSSNLKLSEAIQCSKSSKKSPILKLERQKITHIDLLQPGMSSGIEQLYLSHNLIRRLTNIAQFTSLRVIDLSHNQIEDCTQILALKNIETLQIVKVKGNPFLNLDMSIEVLELLKSKEIDIEFKQKEREMIIESAVLENYLQCIYLEHTLKLIDLHMQFTNKFNLKAEQDINVNFIMSGSKIFKQYDKWMLNRFMQCIKIEAFRIKQNNGMSLQEAYFQMQSDQNNQKEELNKLMIIKFAQYNKLRRKRDRQPTTPSRTTNRNRSQNRNRYGNTEDRSLSPLYNMQLGEQTIRIKVTPSFSKSSLLQTQKKLSKHFDNHSKYDQRYHKNLPKLNPVYNLLYSPLNSLKPTQKDMLIENLSGDLKRMAISLYLKEEQQIDKEQQYSDEIEHYKQALNSSKRQNEELNEIIEEKERQLRFSKGDKETILRLEMMIKERQKDVLHLRNQVEFCKSQLLEVEQQCNKYQEYNQIEEIIKENRQVRRKEEVWQTIIERYMNIKRFKEAQTKRILSQNKQLKFKVIQGFKLLRDKNRKLKNIQKQRKNQHLSNFFTQLAFTKNIPKLYTYLSDKITLKRSKVSFQIIRKALSKRILKKKLNTRSQYYYNKLLLSKSFRSIKIEWIRYNSPAFKHAANQVINHFQMKLKIKALQSFIINKRLAVQQKKQAIDKLNRVCKKQQFQKMEFNKHMKKWETKKRFITICQAKWRYKIRKQCNSKIKEFQLIDVARIRKIKTVVMKLRQNSRKFLGYKQNKLKCVINQLRLVKGFNDFKNVLKTKIKHKRLVTRNIIRSLLKKQYSAFHHLKMLPIHRRIDDAPRINIQQYDHRQSHLLKITQLLKLQIQTKDEETSLCHQKISELEFTLTSQDIKYQQLKAVHQGSILEMRRRQAELLEVIMRMQGKKEYVPIADMKEDLKKARIFNEGDRNSIYKKNF